MLELFMTATLRPLKSFLSPLTLLKGVFSVTLYARFEFDTQSITFSEVVLGTPCKVLNSYGLLFLLETTEDIFVQSVSQTVNHNQKGWRYDHGLLFAKGHGKIQLSNKI